MHRTEPMVLALCCNLVILPVVAGDNGVAGFGHEAGGGDNIAGADQTDEGATAPAGESDDGASSGAASKGKPAGTGTAAGYVYDQVKKGNVKIHGATDTEIPLTQ
jgi:hypothetical protein